MSRSLGDTGVLPAKILGPHLAAQNTCCLPSCNLANSNKPVFATEASSRGAELQPLPATIPITHLMV